MVKWIQCLEQLIICNNIDSVQIMADTDFGALDTTYSGTSVWSLLSKIYHTEASVNDKPYFITTKIQKIYCII